jgi:hypothetical protein
LITEWQGEYYDNPVLAGAPVLIRNDRKIAFSWGMAAPDGRLPADRFSVRWTRTMNLEEGLYRFTVSADDGIRFWVDGSLRVDDWQDGALRQHTLELELSEGDHSFQLDYYESLGHAAVELVWQPIEPPTPTPTPTATRAAPPTLTPTPIVEPTETPIEPPEPTATPTPIPLQTDLWTGQYYDNPFLGGEPVLVEETRELAFDWEEGSPGENVPADGFSARWTKETWMQAGTYRLTLSADDGARLWLDGELLIDIWDTIADEPFAVELEVAEGLHFFQLEYFEAFLGAHLGLDIAPVPQN